MDKPSLEVADIFRAYGQEYREKHGHTLSLQQLRVMRDIEICRTAMLGGHIRACDDENCDHVEISYNSCRNRHCPKCQSLAKANWLHARQAEILPVDYYHLIFTIPDDLLGPVALQNKEVCYNLLFHSAAQTLLTTAADPEHLGAQIGFLALLHTWGQSLTHHPHLHCLAPGGGLSPDGQKWISCPPNYFLDVEVLSRRFQQCLLDALRNAYQRGMLEFHGSIKDLAQQDSFDQLLDSCQEPAWVVYAKPPFAGPEKGLDYLARYTHRVAISNHRLLSMEDGEVTFTCKDYKDSGLQKTITLPAEEFIRRFLLHVLPNGFSRVRYYGLFANRCRANNLQHCRSLLDKAQATISTTVARMDWPELVLFLTGKDPLKCPKCSRGHLVIVEALKPVPRTQVVDAGPHPGIDSS